MTEKQWERWVMQTARSWDDISPIIKETGIAPVDYDHRRLTEYALELNELLLNMESSFSLELVAGQKKLLGQFYNYTQTHFEREEAFLLKFEIPGIERQQREHHRILNRVQNIISEFSTGRLSSAFRLRLQLLDWIIEHVNNTDYEIFDFSNICEAILRADNWDEISGFIRKVHVPPVDFEHKQLTEAIMETGRSIKSYQAGECTKKSILDKLRIVVEKTSRHFRHENEIISNFNIPGLEIQKEQHSRFLTYLKGQIELLEDGSTEKIDELERELLFWWIQHINIYDCDTFLNTDWYAGLFENSRSTDDVAWLINPTGIEVIDSDHRRFVDMLFELRHLSNPDINIQESRKDLLEEMNNLLEYASAHFSREENIMKSKELDNYERHRKEHRRIIGSLESHKRAIENNLMDLSFQLRNILLKWWIEHTNGMDYETFGAEYEN